MSIIGEVPCENQACESCRATHCSPERARTCIDRRCGEQQERMRRFGKSANEDLPLSGRVPLSERWASRQYQKTELDLERAPLVPIEMDAESMPAVSQVRCNNRQDNSRKRNG